VDFSWLTLEASLVYDSEALKPVAFVKTKPIECKPIVDESGDQATLNMKIKVLTSQHEDMFFRVRVFALHQKTRQPLSPPLELVSEPIKVISKPKQSKKKTQSKKRSLNDLLIESVQRIEKHQRRQGRIVDHLLKRRRLALQPLHQHAAPTPLVDSSLGSESASLPPQPHSQPPSSYFHLIHSGHPDFPLSSSLPAASTSLTGMLLSCSSPSPSLAFAEVPFNASNPYHSTPFPSLPLPDAGLPYHLLHHHSSSPGCHRLGASLPIKEGNMSRDGEASSLGRSVSKRPHHHHHHHHQYGHIGDQGMGENPLPLSPPTSPLSTTASTSTTTSTSAPPGNPSYSRPSPPHLMSCHFFFERRRTRTRIGAIPHGLCQAATGRKSGQDSPLHAPSFIP